MSTNNRISDLISSQTPFFVRNDHETFTHFLEAYFEYLEQNEDVLNRGKVVERTKNLLTYIDIDQTIDGFADKLYEQFLQSVPEETIADKDLLIKHITDFYRSKGTEKSLKFLLRVLFEKEATVYYPKVDILRASDGKWFIQQSLRVSGLRVDNTPSESLETLSEFIAHKITGNTSNSFATVERVDRFLETGIQIDELILTNVDGTFENGETVSTTFIDEQDASHSLTANVFGGVITSIAILRKGANYMVGDPLIFESDTGEGANAIVSQVSTGNIRSIVATANGAGFLVNNNILITGGGGSGANAYISGVNLDETYHPNTYNVIISLVSAEANTNLSNAIFSNLAASNINIALINALSTFVYGPTGPINTIAIRTEGSSYSSPPSLDAISNTRVKEAGILGRMEIVSPGANYALGEIIEFHSVYGWGANANVTNVAANGAIRAVKFKDNVGFIIGGFGYKQSQLPTTTIRTANGTGANIIVTATLGDGESFAVSQSNIGEIEAITIISRGAGYETPPTINLEASGDGTAQVNATIIAGVFSYPGRYLNDDGHLSSFNFLQDRDYYQNYSYVVRVRESLANYKRTLREILHPAGMKFFGEYTFVKIDATANSVNASDTIKTIFLPGTWVYNNVSNSISITRTAHGFAANANSYLEFITGDTANVTNGIYRVVTVANANNFTISHSGNNNSSGSVLVGKIT